jgi:flagellin FlaB
MMSKKFAKMRNDKRAEMGVGTMIIFIAMVLVAAVAASVLISTANTVREQAQSTGDQAINNVASGFIVQDVVGTVETNGDDAYTQIINLTIYMRLAAGSPNVNMDNVVVSVTTNEASEYLKANAADRTKAVASTNFGFDKEKNVQQLSAWVLGQGDLAKITITGLTIGYNELVTIKIAPAYGQMTLITFTTPEQYSSDYITLA